MQRHSSKLDKAACVKCDAIQDELDTNPEDTSVAFSMMCAGAARLMSGPHYNRW
jgi:hypothetical protein